VFAGSEVAAMKGQHGPFILYRSSRDVVTSSFCFLDCLFSTTYLGWVEGFEVLTSFRLPQVVDSSSAHTAHIPHILPICHVRDRTAAPLRDSLLERL
jgi:hypothetical protein